MTLYRQAHADRSDGQTRQRQTVLRLERIRGLYVWGGRDQFAYRENAMR